MLIKITPKTKGNRVNVRKAMSGKGNDVIVTTLADGEIVEAKATKGGEWYKVAEGYVLATLAQEVPGDSKK